MIRKNMEEVNTLGFSIRKGFITPEMCDLIVLTSALSPDRNIVSGSKSIVGRAIDAYGTPHCDGLLLIIKDKLESEGGFSLIPTYSYFRAYTNGCTLKAHLDRDECEISVSIALSENDWTFDCTGLDGKDHSLALNKGDAIVYRGADIMHGRLTPLREEESHHVFLHYVSNIPENEKYMYDGRMSLGMRDTQKV